MRWQHRILTRLKLHIGADTQTGLIHSVSTTPANVHDSQELSKLPLDPRVGRMILEARDRQSLTEVLIIASALSGQDVRDRPLEQQQAADEKHKKFDDERSEFLGMLRLWQWIGEGRGHQPDRCRTTGHQRSNPGRIRCWRRCHAHQSRTSRLAAGNARTGTGQVRGSQRPCRHGTKRLAG